MGPIFTTGGSFNAAAWIEQAAQDERSVEPPLWMRHLAAAERAQETARATGAKASPSLAGKTSSAVVLSATPPQHLSIAPPTDDIVAATAARFRVSPEGLRRTLELMGISPAQLTAHGPLRMVGGAK